MITAQRALEKLKYALNSFPYATNFKISKVLKLSLLKRLKVEVWISDFPLPFPTQQLFAIISVLETNFSLNDVLQTRPLKQPVFQVTHKS